MTRIGSCSPCGRMAGEDALFLRADDGTVDAANFGGYPVTRLIPASRPTA